MTSFVLDASVTMSWLLADAKPSDRAYAEAVLDAMSNPQARAAVPVTWALEVSNVLARAEAKGVLSEAQSEAFLELLSNAPIQADTATFSRALTDTLHLARRHGLSAYDASYLELALRTGQPLATLDTDLARAARKAGVKRFAGH
jgi:predicted nucleic acid-binding protein